MLQGSRIAFVCILCFQQWLEAFWGRGTKICPGERCQMWLKMCRETSPQNIVGPKALQDVSFVPPPPPNAPPALVTGNASASSSAPQPPPPSPGNYVAQIQALQTQVANLKAQIVLQGDTVTKALKEADDKFSSLSAELEAVNKRIDVASHFWE
jgi:type IV secretory pathway VirB10-like protein